MSILVFEESDVGKRIIDLTVTLTNNMPAHKFFPRPVVLPHFDHDDFLKMDLVFQAMRFPVRLHTSGW